MTDRDLYHVRLTCSACGKEIDRTQEREKHTLRQEWVLIAMGSAFGHGCPSCGSRTWSDANIHTDLTIFRGDEKVDKTEVFQ